MTGSSAVVGLLETGAGKELHGCWPEDRGSMNHAFEIILLILLSGVVLCAALFGSAVNSLLAEDELRDKINES